MYPKSNTKGSIGRVKFIYSTIKGVKIQLLYNGAAAILLVKIEHRTYVPTHHDWLSTEHRSYIFPVTIKSTRLLRSSKYNIEGTRRELLWWIKRHETSEQWNNIIAKQILEGEEIIRHQEVSKTNMFLFSINNCINFEHLQKKKKKKENIRYLIKDLLSQLDIKQKKKIRRYVFIGFKFRFGLLGYLRLHFF